MGEGVQEGVGGRVVPQAQLAGDRGDRGEQDERLRLVTEEFVQQYGADGLGAQHPLGGAGILDGEHAATGDSGGVHHALDRAQFGSDPVHGGAE